MRDLKIELPVELSVCEVKAGSGINSPFRIGVNEVGIDKPLITRDNIQVRSERLNWFNRRLNVLQSWIPEKQPRCGISREMIDKRFITLGDKSNSVDGADLKWIRWCRASGAS